MSVSETISLFLVMTTLALIPSSSVTLVITRTITHGLSNGILASVGIVLGDILLIFFAILSLAIVAETYEWLFLLIKYVGSIYLLWLGFALFTSKSVNVVVVGKCKTISELVTSFISGLLLTIGDIKAIFFYGSLLPAFVSFVALQLSDLILITIITIFSVGGAKLMYAFSAKKLASIHQKYNLTYKVEKIAGVLLICIAFYLFIITII